MNNLTATLPAPTRTWPLAGLFLLLGVMYATWAARIPAIRDAFSLDAAALGSVLLASGVGAVLAFPLSAWTISRYGARRVALWSGLALLGLLPLLPWLPNVVALGAGLLLIGVTSSCFDVAINALGAAAEREAGRALMSRLHAWFCVGTFIGALLGSAAAAAGLAPASHFLLCSLVLIAGLLLAIPAIPSPPRSAKHQPSATFAMPHGALFWLGCIVLLGAITEGSASSWIALYLQDHLGAAPGIAPLGYAAFAGAMLLARLWCDQLKERFGARLILSASSALAASGFVAAACAPSIPLAIAGFFAAGAGVAALFPFVFSAAGRQGPAALAAVATMGYGGSLLGPPLMGQIVHLLGLPGGMLLLAGSSLALTGLAWRAHLLDEVIGKPR